jgi:RNA polymerase sigma-70 factor (ECF subfamily)
VDDWSIDRERWRQVYRFAYRMLGRREEAEDVVQEALLRLARNGSAVTDGESTRRWLFVVARNLCLDRLRRHARRRETLTEDVDRLGALERNPAEAAAGRERAACIAAAIAELTPELREAIILREYEAMNYEQIADVTGCPLGTIKSRIARAREALRRRLEPILEEER